MLRFEGTLTRLALRLMLEFVPIYQYVTIFNIIDSR